MRPVVLLFIVCSLGCTCSPSFSTPRTDIPSYSAPNVDTAPVLDGVLNDEAWQNAPFTETFVNTMDGSGSSLFARAKFCWDEEQLYAAFEVRDDFIHATLHGHDPHLWTQDTVELMFDPDGDGANYFELQFSPTEETFDTRYDQRRLPQPFGHTAWESGIHGAAYIDGQPNDQGADRGYTVEVAIPWRAFNAGSPPANPPTNGDSWRMALYVLDRQRQGQRGIGWSAPLLPDFHVPTRFGTLRFE